MKNKKMKKIIFLFFVVLLFCAIFSACEFGIVNTVPYPTFETSTPFATEEPTSTEYTDITEPPTEYYTEIPSPTPTEEIIVSPTVEVTEAPTETPSPTPTATPLPTPFANPSQTVKLVSFNIDGINDISKRKEYLLNLLLSQSADSIGLQEVMGEWNDYLKEGMKQAGYGRVGVDAGGHEESKYGYFATYIFYNENKFNLLSSDTFWMSETPEVSTKYGPTVTCFRTCTWAILQDKDTGFTYVHMNLHLDWEDEEVTITQVKMIQKLLLEFHELGYPVFASGDFNSKEDSNPYKEMLSDERIVDCKQVATEASNTFTYHNYNRIKDRYTLDYCFTIGSSSAVKEYNVLSDIPNGVYLSDHFGISITAEVNACEIAEQYKQEPITNVGMIMFALETEKSGTIFIDTCRDTLGINAKYYMVSIYDDSGLLTFEKKLSGDFYRSNSKEFYTISLKNMLPGRRTVVVTPVSFLGVVGKKYLYHIYIPNYEGVDLGDGDLVSIHIDENGNIVNRAETDLELETVGTVSVVDSSIGKAMYFDGKGNVKVNGFKNLYSLMEEGFALEVYFKTTDNVTRKQAIVSNFHSGGLGFEIENGKLLFSVWVSGGYKRVVVDVEQNREYHVVGVYTTSVLILYVNGEMVGETRISGSIGFPTLEAAKYLCIGADSNATGNGESQSVSYIKYVDMWSFPLVSGQVEKLYNKTEKPKN